MEVGSFVSGVSGANGLSLRPIDADLERLLWLAANRDDVSELSAYAGGTATVERVRSDLIEAATAAWAVFTGDRLLGFARVYDASLRDGTGWLHLMANPQEPYSGIDREAAMELQASIFRKLPLRKLYVRKPVEPGAAQAPDGLTLTSSREAYFPSHRWAQGTLKDEEVRAIYRAGGPPPTRQISDLDPSPEQAGHGAEPWERTGGFRRLTRTLVGSHVRLRPIEQTDYPWLYDMAVSADILHSWVLRSVPPSPDEFVERMWHGVDVCMVLERIETEVPIGIAWVYGLNLRHGFCWLSLALRAEYRHRVWPIEGFFLFASYVFVEFLLNKMYVEVAEPNGADTMRFLRRHTHLEAHYPEHEVRSGRLTSSYVFATYRREADETIGRFIRHTPEGSRP